MRLTIKKVGPVDEAEVELGDITVLLGPPNTGKSYTLKALYSSLLMLDSVVRKSKLRDIIYRFEVSEPTFKVRDLCRALAIVTSLYKSGKITSEDAKVAEDTVIIETGADQFEWYVKDNNLVATFKKESYLDLGELFELLEIMYRFLWYMLPSTEESRVELLPEPPISEIRLMILGQLERQSIYRKEHYDPEFDLKLVHKIVLELEKEKLSIKEEVEANWDLANPRLVSLLERLAAMNAKYAEAYLSSRLCSVLLRPPLHLEFKFERLYQAAIRGLEKKIGKSLESLYRETFGLQSARFIPFGRTPFVCEVEYISHEPLFRVSFVEEYEFDPIFYSYVHWLSDGRGKFIERRYDEKVVRIFNPVLQGEVMYNPQTSQIEYERWGYKKVPLRVASALASEITGVLFPMLATPPNSCIIIEEPEAQLHHSAQALMALALAGISAEFDHKVVFSTHSDIFAVVLAYLKELNPSEDQLVDLISRLLNIQNIHVERDKLEMLAKTAVKAKDLDIRFYYYEPTSEGVKVSERKAEDILKEVPGITTVIDALASWALSL